MVFASLFFLFIFFFQAEDGIRDLVRSRGLGDVYKRQVVLCSLDGRLGDFSSQHALKIRRQRHREIAIAAVQFE